MTIGSSAGKKGGAAPPMRKVALTFLAEELEGDFTLV